MKRCSTCGRELPADAAHFILAKECRGGLAGTCRDCSAAGKRAWKARKGESLRARRRALYAGRYGPVQRRKEQERADRFPVRVRAQRLRAGMRERARELGLAFDDEHFTVSRLMGWLSGSPTCECCRRVLDVGFKHDAQKHDDSPSMDRFAPELGYVAGNVALLCWRCNNLKRDASAAELECVAAWMRRKVARARAAAPVERVDEQAALFDGAPT